MRKFFILLACSLLVGGVSAQQDTLKYRISLKDKAVTTYTLDNPGAFLSQKAIERRQKQHLAVDSTDLPVCRKYVDEIRKHGVHDLGYSSEFYLDAKEKKYIDECGAANFFGIRDNTYITPKSTSILPSITNKSLMQLAKDMGLKVECRPVPEEELNLFEEAGACVCS